MTERILFVDDEANILEAYRRTLRKSFDVKVAQGGLAALNMIDEEGDFPVVVSDMQMPEMNGIEFLSKIKESSPDTIRIMLTGNADQQTAASAINESDVFRFLNKPCPPEKMTLALNDALAVYKQRKAEQELLESTVKDCIKTMAEILSITNPKLFGRTTKIKNYMLACATQLKLTNVWELEAAALTCQIGLATLSPSFYQRAIKRENLSKQEIAILHNLPNTSAELINRIPRLENVAEIVRNHDRYFDGSGGVGTLSGEELPIGSRILRVIKDIVFGEQKGRSALETLEKMQGRAQKYDPNVLAAIALVINKQANITTVEKIGISQLTEGMILANNVATFSGALLIRRGEEMTASTILRLNNFFANGEIPDTLSVHPSDTKDMLIDH